MKIHTTFIDQKTCYKDVSSTQTYLQLLQDLPNQILNKIFKNLPNWWLIPCGVRKFMCVCVYIYIQIYIYIFCQRCHCKGSLFNKTAIFLYGIKSHLSTYIYERQITQIIDLNIKQWNIQKKTQEKIFMIKDGQRLLVHTKQES